MLNQLGTVELSGRKVWFQLKGVHKGTVSEGGLARVGHVPIRIRLDDLRFWYAAPEATYLVVYVEAIDAFLAEDVRDIVDDQWGVVFLEPDRFGAQETITVHVAAHARLDDRRLDSMVAHRSMRIDGPAFRGRPLGTVSTPFAAHSENSIPSCSMASSTISWKRTCSPTSSSETLVG
jgi:hypothetical protein